MKKLHQLRGEAIVARFAQERGISLKDLLGRNKSRKFSKPRQDLMKRIRDETDYSLPQIGTIIGRHHTTVSYGIRASEAREEARKRREALCRR